MYPLRALLLLLGAGGIYTAVSLLFNGLRTAGITVLVFSFVLLMTAEVYNHRKLRRDWFYREFRSYERFRAEMDHEELRGVREERGDAGVVRHMKTLYPLLPVPELLRLLKDL